MKRVFHHFLKISDLSKDTLREILEIALQIKQSPDGSCLGRKIDVLCQKMALAMIFDQPSTRTRLSFDLAMRALGGDVLMLTGTEMQLGRGESIADTARVLSRYVDILVIRTLDHGVLEEFARYATIPIVNGLTKKAHPCQIMADILTFEEKKGSIADQHIAWVGDCNNVLASWIEAARLLGFHLHIATPDFIMKDYAPLRGAAHVSDAPYIHITDNPFEAVEQAQCIVTDCWVSMGDKEPQKRRDMLMPYQVSTQLMAHAPPDCLFMHCLPAHREEEVSGAVIDGPQSIVFDEAENRLHVQKSILCWALKVFG